MGGRGRRERGGPRPRRGGGAPRAGPHAPARPSPPPAAPPPPPPPPLPPPPDCRLAPRPARPPRLLRLLRLGGEPGVSPHAGSQASLPATESPVYPYSLLLPEVSLPHVRERHVLMEK